MPEEQIISKNSLIKFSSDYEYVLGQTMGKILEFQGAFSKSDFLRENVEQIAYDLEDTAKMFAAEQGLSPGELGYDGRVNTGRLYNGIHANLESRGKGYSVHLKSTARDDRGNFYGGHVEFGHTTSGKVGYVLARPHLRPALYAVSEASRNKLGSVMHNLFKSIVMNETGLNYSFRKSANFGSAYGGSPKYYRQGPGKVTKTLSSGQRGRMMRSNLGWNTKYSRNFQSQFSVIRGMRNSAALQMGWGLGKGKSFSGQKANSYRGARTQARRLSNRRRGSGNRHSRRVHSTIKQTQRANVRKRALANNKNYGSRTYNARVSRSKSNFETQNRMINEAKTLYSSRR